ncbi:multidrug efflux pump subunit AcrA (membrane-fusion protein) [Ulvibacter sp. MAR_2010_11]|uniref:efflux RND transporter periplasmic adaptor subunit n=1 Tax=Ulvibacter sp. MAR_2010_11 TaxID=1250229 RepID=UPI000C2CE0AE|nr:HlyD family efflux transporter periplasmic adaptor subunit [Ulvibacter sp. MAR_2010_11]PKA82463.1 multidrug efflux pump subunit AcrA (membrane-fusion protein) [Ulvibacter sp. MAR_2010_11]
MRKIINIFIGAALIVGAILGANAIIKSNTKQRPKADKVIKTVFIETVENKTITISIPASGILVAKNRLELYSEVQGIFQSSARDFKAGQAYRSGETLLRINASEYYASVQAAKSEFYNLVTSLMPDLRLDYPEAFPVWQRYLTTIDVNKSTPPLPEITSDNVNYFITGRGVFTSYYNIKNLEQRLGKYGISAPFNGVVTEALVTKGTLIRQGQKLGEFIDTSVFEVELAIEKEYSDLLKLGENVALTTLEGDQSYIGTVSRVNERIDQATQTIKVFVEVKGENLKEGMYLEALLQAKSEPNAIEISRKLLVDETQLFIVRDSILDVVEVQPVHFSSKTVVVKGVPNGTHILSKPIPGAYAGMLVKEFKETATDSLVKPE